MKINNRPLALIILDGFGYSENKEGNAIASANTPFWNDAWERGARTLLSGSGHSVGLPPGQMGNSEVGHLNMGAGRVVYQDFTRIQNAITDGSFMKNEIFLNAINSAVAGRKTVHILGLLSAGGVHSHEKHIHAMVELAANSGVKKLYIHAFLDGRDTPPRSAVGSIEALEKVLSENRCGKIASIIGRYYAMDRDNRWERVQQAYDLLTAAHAEFSAKNAEEALAMAYQRNESDEFVKATSIHAANEPGIKIEDGDTVIFMNYRADRAREITNALIMPEFNGFQRKKILKLSQFVSLTQYDNRFPCPAAFPPIFLTNILGEYLSSLGLRQLRIAETEKYAHVTFFFNGGVEMPFANEERLLIPSLNVATYDLQPEMNAPLLTEKLVDAIHSNRFDVIVCNFANPDMVGHTGNFAATVKAIETIDECLKKIAEALNSVGGEMIVTADHGNAEKMFDEKTSQAHTAHTSEPVPFLYLGRPATVTMTEGTLSDVAPTMLYIMGIEQPLEMTGKPLIAFK